MAEQAAPGGDPTKTALICGREMVSFETLGERAERARCVFVELGLSPGDRIAVMLRNSPAFFEVGLGAASARCPVVPVNWHLKADEIAWVVGDSGCVLVADVAFADEAHKCVASLADCRLLLVGDNGPGGYEARLVATVPDAPSWRAPAYVYFTSGTTGRPRAVEREAAAEGVEGQMLAGLAAMWGLTAADRYLACSPLYHAGNAYAYATLLLGGTVTLMERWDAAEWLRTVDEQAITACFMVPAFFIRLLELPAEVWANHDTSSLRLILHAAAPCPVPVKWKMLEALPRTEIWEFYGATEGGATRISPDDWRNHPGSVGTPWPGTEIAILDAHHQPVAAGETGTIYVRPAGGGRFRYRNDADKTREAWVDDAFTVGDVGHLDEDGFLYVTDRRSDMVLRGGVNIYPAEVEAVLHSHPHVVDCAVLGVPDDRLGEELLALVEVRGDVSPEEIRRHCADHLAAFKCPRYVEIVTALPRDPTGKVLKRHLRARDLGPIDRPPPAVDAK